MLEPRNKPEVFIITEEIYNRAKEIAPTIKITRTKTSPHDQLIGALGELVASQVLYGSIDKSSAGANKGKVDFEKDNIEVKCSWFPFRENLNLLVRKDYAKSRKPRYIQLIIDKPHFSCKEIRPGHKVYICGWADSSTIDSAPLKDFGSKFGSKGGYECHYIPITELQPMSKLKLKENEDNN